MGALPLTDPAGAAPDGLDGLAALLGGYRYRFHSERDLQDGIERVLQARRITYRREQALSTPDRPDFLVGDVAVEVKIKGALADLLRQIGRYASHASVGGILVIGTTIWLPRVPPILFDKPVRSTRLVASLL